MINLDDAWADAVQYLETLGDARRGDITLNFMRTDDNRRPTMKKNKSPIVYVMAQVSVRLLPGDSADGAMQFKHFNGRSADAALAINGAMTQLKAWLPQPVKQTVAKRESVAQNSDLAFLD